MGRFFIRVAATFKDRPSSSRSIAPLSTNRKMAREFARTLTTQRACVSGEPNGSV
jgi:hypothetical protein